MQFKRNEPFRFEFKPPLEAKFKVLLDGIAVDGDQAMHGCNIMDISPQGMKMFSESKFGEHINKILQIEVHFILDEMTITAIGNIMWDRPYSSGKFYGLTFSNQPKLENMIISELKSRRRKEVLNKK